MRSLTFRGKNCLFKLVFRTIKQEIKSFPHTEYADEKMRLFLLQVKYFYPASENAKCYIFTD